MQKAMSSHKTLHPNKLREMGAQLPKIKTPRPPPSPEYSPATPRYKTQQYSPTTPQ